MNGRRSDIEIVAEILRLARSGAGQTRIMYGSNLNYGRLRHYLDSLEARGLVSVSRHRQRVDYVTTDIGKCVMEQVERALTALDDLEPVGQVLPPSKPASV